MFAYEHLVFFFSGIRVYENLCFFFGTFFLVWLLCYDLICLFLYILYYYHHYYYSLNACLFSNRHGKAVNLEGRGGGKELEG